MIRWCSYCQRLIGERAPLTQYAMTHGICRRCDAQLDQGEALIAHHRDAHAFYRALDAAAFEGDRGRCAELVSRARAEGLRTIDVLIGVVQPALVAIGDAWENGAVTVVDEHRFTAWCAEMISLLDCPAPEPGPLDLVINLAPGNRHDLGPRIAELALRAAGARVEFIPAALKTADLLQVVRDRRAASVGWSCAQPEMVPGVVARAEALRAAGFAGPMLLSGQALRRQPALVAGDLLVACATVEETLAALGRPSDETG